MLSVILIYAECHYTECHYAECRDSCWTPETFLAKFPYCGHPGVPAYITQNYRGMIETNTLAYSVAAAVAN